MNKFTRLVILGLSVTQLAACQTVGERLNTQQDQKAKIDSAIDKALTQASERNAGASLMALERQYKRNSANPQIAYKYARALRQADYAHRADIILSPFANAPDAPSVILSEMSSIKLALGNFKSAEEYAQKAVLKDPKNYAAYQNLGIALESQEKHAAAERAFRKGLETWQGDPTPIMNNLALNLATQGYLDEAIQILEKAKALSPDRIEIERNLRIVRALNEH